MEEYYKIGIVYQIYNINDPKMHYIGSSFNDISIRWKDHVSDYNKYLKDDRKPASTIYPYFKEFDIKNFEIRELSEYKVTCNAHLKMYEQLYINKYKPVNRINPFNILANMDRKNYQKQHYINNKEYFDNYIENNKEKIKEYKARNYQKNKEKLAEKQKIYREINKVKVKESKKEYNIKNREKLAEKNKNYYNENKNLLNEKNKIYREQNKEKISAQNKEKIIYEICNTEITKCNYSKHIKTNKHLKKLENMDN